MLKRFSRVGTTWCVLLAFMALAGSASALSQTAQDACNPAILPTPPGASDNVDFGNAIRIDDAIVCVGQFDVAHGIMLGDTTSFINELANVASHELGHVLGLVHTDSFDFGIPGFDPTALMTVVDPFDGTDRSFSTPGEQGKLNGLGGPVQVVWLDFLAAQPGLDTIFFAWDNSPEVKRHGVDGAAAIAAAEDLIKSNMDTDYGVAWSGGATFSFYLTQAAAESAATGSGQASGTYSTVSFVAVPEPSTGLLIAQGILALTLARTSRRGRRRG